MAQTRPNVLLVTIDSWRADAFLSGQQIDTARSLTPHLDAWAKDAVVFRRALAQGPRTTVSFPAILCGTYPCSLGGYEVLSTQRLTLAEFLKHAGYATGGFHSNPYVSRSRQYHRGFDHFEDNLSETYVWQEAGWKRWRKRTALWRFKIKGLLGDIYQPADRLNAQAFSWFDTSTEPFFAWVHYMDIHGPYTSTQHHHLTRRLALARTWYKALHAPDTMTAADCRLLRRGYDDNLRFLDQQLRVLLERMDTGNSIVIITADHGELFGEHGLYGHPRRLYHRLLHVPLLLKLPAHMAPPERDITSPVGLIDLFPTLIDLLGLEPPKETLHGQSVVPLMRGEAPAHEPHVISELVPGCMSVTTSEWQCIGNYTKRAKYGHAETELYDLASDPEETVNLAAQHPDTVRVFQEVLHQHALATLGDVTAPEEAALAVEDNEMVRARLRALGYLDE